eukprot:EG_transcript_6774
MVSPLRWTPLPTFATPAASSNNTPTRLATAPQFPAFPASPTSASPAALPTASALRRWRPSPAVQCLIGLSLALVGWFRPGLGPIVQVSLLVGLAACWLQLGAVMLQLATLEDQLKGTGNAVHRLQADIMAKSTAVTEVPCWSPEAPLERESWLADGNDLDAGPSQWVESAPTSPINRGPTVSLTTQRCRDFLRLPPLDPQWTRRVAAATAAAARDADQTQALVALLPHRGGQACEVVVWEATDRGPALCFTSAAASGPQNIAASTHLDEPRATAIEQAVQASAPLAVRVRTFAGWMSVLMVPLPGNGGRGPKWVEFHLLSDTTPPLYVPPRSLLQPRPAVGERADAAAVTELRAGLQALDPGEDLRYFDDEFLAAALARPGRTLRYCLEKCTQTLYWRRLHHVASLSEEEVRFGLESACIFWHRYDRLGRPVLYLRPAQQDMATADRAQTLLAICWTLEGGLRLMAPGVTTCLLVIDARGAGWAHFDIPLTRSIMTMASVGYRDRVDQIVVGPVSAVVTAAWRFCRPLMAQNLRTKILITDDPQTELEKLIDPPDIPPGLFTKPGR